MQYAESIYFVENLTRLMEQKGLTKYRLAQMVPCSQSTVANWFNGAIPRGLTKARLLEVLDVSEAELFEDNKKSPVPNEDEADKSELIRILSVLDSPAIAELLAHAHTLEALHEARGNDPKSP